MSLLGVKNGTHRIEYYVPLGTNIELWGPDLAWDGEWKKRGVKTILEILMDASDLRHDPAGRNEKTAHFKYPSSYIFDIKEKDWNLSEIRYIRVDSADIEQRFVKI